MDTGTDRTRTEIEQARVRLGALGVMLGALVIAAVLVGLQVWTVAAASAGIAAVAWWWAARMYADLSEQEHQRQALTNARRRFVDGPADQFEG
jgi:hypothetical protein